VIDRDHQALLLTAARDAIRDRMAGTGASAPDAGGLPHGLNAPGASFVTLTVDRGLRGCIGSIMATRPLVADVWNNARAAAFEDPRFPPLGEFELRRAALEIAVLGPLEPVSVASEAELLESLRPGVDGLLIRHGAQRATFLPKVWDSLADPVEFLRHLKRKMGQPDDFWDAALVIERYETQEFSGPLIP